MQKIILFAAVIIQLTILGNASAWQANNSILVVDDDEGVGNLFDLQNYLTTALDDEGYTYDVYNVGNNGFSLGEGPPIETLDDYEVVIWYSPNDDEDINPFLSAITLDETDETNLGIYLEAGGKLWFISQEYLDESGHGTFNQTYLHVADYGNDVGISDPIIGVTGDLIGEGLSYTTGDAVDINGTSRDTGYDLYDNGDWILPDLDASSVFWQDLAQTRYSAIRYGNGSTVYKTVFSAFEFSLINNSIDRAELVDGVIQWMNATAAEIPVADAGLAVMTANIDDPLIFNGSGSWDPEGDNLSYSWDFGDGNNSGWANVPTTNHTYYIDGTYTVILTVDDGNNNTDTDKIFVTVNPNHSPIADAGPDQDVTEGYTVIFNGSGSWDPDNDTLTYYWDFGDGNNSGWVNVPTTNHTYGTFGTYEVILSVDDGYGTVDTDSISVIVNGIPIADAGPDQEATEGYTVIFNGSGSWDPDNDTLTYYWDFGDGNNSGWVNVPTTNHTYGTFGTYEVILTVDDLRGGIDTDKMTAYANAIGNNRPIADAGPNRTLSEWNVSISFNSSGSIDPDGDNLTYSWDFDASVDSDGDGDFINDGDAIGEVAINTYGVGNYLVTLTVNDGRGRMDQDTIFVQILAPFTILVVDDDDGPGNNGIYYDMENYYTTALDEGGYVYDIYTVYHNMDGPQLSTLNNYDVVIWFTGEDFFGGISDGGTLTETDETNLMNYLDGGGRLWFSSQDFLLDHGIDDFTRNYLHVVNYLNYEGVPSSLIGVDGDSIGNGTNYSTSPEWWDYGDFIEPDMQASPIFFQDENQTRYNAIRYGEGTFYVVFFAFEFAFIQDLTNRAELVDHILEWMYLPIADAGPDQEVTEGDAVYFNGSGSWDPDNDTLTYYWDFGDGNNSVWANVPTTNHTYGTFGTYEVVLTVDDGRGHIGSDNMIAYANVIGNNRPLADAGPNQILSERNESIALNGSGSIDPDGDNLTYSWDFDASVDSDGDGDFINDGDAIGEVAINTYGVGNYLVTLTVNDGRGRMDQDTISIHIFSPFTILVVDDDDGPRNGNYWVLDMEYFMTLALDKAGYPYDTYIVEHNIDGPSISTLNNFNLVIWLTGEDSNGTLTLNDKTNLESYLDGGGLLWLVSQDLLYELGCVLNCKSVLDNFAENYLHVFDFDDDAGTPNPLKGVDGDPIGDGLSYPTKVPTFFSDNADWIMPDQVAFEMFDWEPGYNAYTAIRYGSESTMFKTVFFAFEFSMINNLADRAELAYRSLQWLANGTVDTTPPTITLTSPQNITYTSSSVALNYSVNETILWGGVSIDGSANQTGGNQTLTGLSNGQHYLTVSVYDTAGNMDSSTVYFTVNSTSGNITYLNISLTSGWNMISIPLEQDNWSIPWVLNSIWGNYTDIYAYVNGMWYWDTSLLPFFKLTDMAIENGYWINMSTAETLELNGTVPSTTTISVVPKWNLVGYPTFATQNITTVLPSIGYTDVYTYKNGMWYWDTSLLPFFVLTEMTTGQGYWINATGSGSYGV